MNITFIGIIIIVILVITSIILGCIKKSMPTLLFSILGIISLAIGCYLLPATMWRVFSIFFLSIGILFELIALIITIRKFTK